MLSFYTVATTAMVVIAIARYRSSNKPNTALAITVEYCDDDEKCPSCDNPCQIDENGIVTIIQDGQEILPRSKLIKMTLKKNKLCCSLEARKEDVVINWQHAAPFKVLIVMFAIAFIRMRWIRNEVLGFPIQEEGE